MTLSAEDFWRLRALDAQLQLLAAQRSALYEALAARYGFDPTKTYQFDDTACALVPAEKETT